MSKSPNYRKLNNRNSSGMAIEKMLIAIEKYLGLDFILMLLGLLHESDGMRGYPFVWAGGGPERIPAFFSSLAVITALVIIGDIITKAIIRINEPVTNVQKTLDKYASTYSEYEDPYVTEIKYNSSAPARVSTSSPRRTSASNTGKSAARTSRYEKTIASDYEKIKGILSEQQKRAKENTEGRTVSVGSMLNGKKADRYSKNNNSSGVVVALIVVIMVISTFIFSAIGSIPFFRDDDNWGDDIIADDYSSSDSIVLMGQEMLDQLSTGDAEWFESIGGSESDTEKLLELTGYDLSYYECVYTGYNGYGEDMEGVARFRLESNDRNYLAAFKFAGDDIDSEESIPELTGFAICPYPEFDEEDASLYFGTTSLDIFLEDNGYDDDQSEKYRDEIASNTISAGSSTVDDTSILNW